MDFSITSTKKKFLPWQQVNKVDVGQGHLGRAQHVFPKWFNVACCLLWTDVFDSLINLNIVNPHKPERAGWLFIRI